MAKILIIEDSLELANIYLERLKFDKHTVMIAQNGQDGITKISQFKPDCVLLDIVLPIISGLEVLKTIRKTPYFKNLPVIVISAFASPENAKKALSLGAVEFIEKEKIDPSDLSIIVSKHLSSAHS